MIKQLITYSTLILFLLMGVAAHGQDFRTAQFVGTLSDGNCLVYDGVTDMRLEPGPCGADDITDLLPFPNDQFLTWRNAANTADQNVLKLDTSNYTELHGGGKITLDAGGTGGVYITLDGSPYELNIGDRIRFAETYAIWFDDYYHITSNNAGSQTFWGGAAALQSYGAYLRLSGFLDTDDDATRAGDVRIGAGGVAGAQIQLYDKDQKEQVAVDENGMWLAENLTFEGSTADGFETTFSITDPTADRTITFPDAGGVVAVSIGDCASGGCFDGNGDGNNLWFEGLTADANETVLTVVDPTADRTVKLPNATGTLLLNEDIDTAAEIDAIITDGALDDDDLTDDTTTTLSDVDSGAGTFSTTLGVVGGTWTGTSSSNRTINQIGNYEYIHLQATGTCGSDATYLTFTVPTDAYGSTAEFMWTCNVDDSSVSRVVPAAGFNVNGGTTIRVYPPLDHATWANGVCSFFCNGIHLIG